jgi:hypothetical protein
MVKNKPFSDLPSGFQRGVFLILCFCAIFLRNIFRR